MSVVTIAINIIVVDGTVRARAVVVFTLSFRDVQERATVGTEREDLSPFIAPLLFGVSFYLPTSCVICDSLPFDPPPPLPPVSLFF